MYEIVAGHNRVEASRLAGDGIISCDVREKDGDIATIADYIIRETALPSEKAWVYRYKLKVKKLQETTRWYIGDSTQNQYFE